MWRHPARRSCIRPGHCQPARGHRGLRERNL
ncbi:MAG: phage DNA packaging protein J [Desulfovibrio sp.]|nr:phage DNA packaging protein J [Desulfovibrio sp.]